MNALPPTSELSTEHYEVADSSKLLEIQRFAEGDLSRASPGIAPKMADRLVQ